MRPITAYCCPPEGGCRVWLEGDAMRFKNEMNHSCESTHMHTHRHRAHVQYLNFAPSRTKMDNTHTLNAVYWSFDYVEHSFIHVCVDAKTL